MTSSRALSPTFGLPEVDFEHLFEFAPFLLQQGTESTIPKPSSSPITFFDKHLNDSLILKKVRALPSLISTISEALDDYVSGFNSKNESFDSPRLYLSPEGYHHPELKSVFWMDNGRPGSPDGFNSQKHSLKCDAQDTLSMWDNLPELATWDMYALSGKSVLEDMSGLATLDIFPWKRCGTLGTRQFTSSARVSLQDVSTYLWETVRMPSSDVVPAVVGTAYPRRGERLKGRPSPRSLAQVSPKKKSPRSFKVKDSASSKIAVPKSGRRTAGYKVIAADFVQRAWARAVHSDSIFIIFDCGNFLRVGLRHRKTQTLYISELIDVVNCSNPPFGKLMVAINAAILRDAVDRAPLFDPTLIKGKGLHACKPRKRPWDKPEEAAPVRRSRRRLGETLDETSSEKSQELLSRNIALLYFHHGNYHSNSPS
ncbi:hypothetical protein F5146DRAFT_1078809, partial [Armillaria mellea]